MFSGLQEKALFLYKFLQAPARTGSLLPSSRKLAEALLAPIPWAEVNHLAELGAGTGAVTQYLPLEREGLEVLLLEQDPELRRHLKSRYPDCRYYSDSSRLRLAVHNEKLKQLDCVVSGLPLWSMRSFHRRNMLAQVASSLKDKRLFIAFSYFSYIKRDLKSFFEIERTAFVPLNFPPAFVYVCRKKPEQETSLLQTGWQQAASPKLHLLLGK